MAGPGTKVIPGKYVSAWGGIQSAGQTLGQMVSAIHSLGGLGLGYLTAILRLSGLQRMDWAASLHFSFFGCSSWR